MRVISRSRLVEFWSVHKQAQTSLRHWYAVTNAARWSSLTDVRHTFRHADPVRVSSGKAAVVFNVGGNNVRLIAAVHYNRNVVYVLRVLTHEEYDKGLWKREL